MRASRRDLSLSVRRLWKAAGIAVLAVLLILLLESAAQVLLILFGGLILGAYLTGVSSLIETHTRLGPRVSITLVLLLHGVLSGLFVFWAITSGAPEVEHLAKELPAAVSELRSRLSHTSWGSALLDAIPAAADQLPSGGEWFSKITGVMSGVVWVMASTAVLVFVGIYIAVDPESYRRGLLHLIPPKRRETFGTTLDEVVHTLRMWVLGRILGAAVIGVGVWIGLTILGIPLALLLGLLSGALTFIPNIGPITSVIPPLLLALVDDPVKALWVIALYVGLQLIESYILTPIIEKRAVKVPPALLLGGQILFGVLTGLVGVAFAAPLIAVAMVAVRRLYVDHVLEDEEQEPTLTGAEHPA